MKKVAILLDSSSTYNGKGIDDIFMIPIKIILNEGGIKEFEEFINIDKNQIYKWVEEGKKLSTSQPSMGESLLIIEDLLKKYEKIFVLPISKGISGTYETMVSVANEIDSNRVIVLDTGFFGHEILNLSKEILFKVNNGASTEEIIEFIKDFKEKFHACIIVNDINNLKRGGRIGTLKSWMANLLKLKIILEFNTKLEFFDKKTSLKEAIETSLDQINLKLDLKNNEIKRIELWNNNSRDSESIKQAKIYINEWFKKQKINISQILFDDKVVFPGVITVHTGINTIGIITLLK